MSPPSPKLDDVQSMNRRPVEAALPPRQPSLALPTAECDPYSSLGIDQRQFAIRADRTPGDGSV